MNYRIRHQPHNIPDALHKFYPNQSRLNIDLIDMNGPWICNHLQSLKMVGFIVAVSKDNNFIVKNVHPG